ncbi:MAG: hypothetical protein IJ960_00905 [Oscillospiraceae bacterium]|nr:hypothetical protein [Oscillospiraceae bacterium]
MATYGARNSFWAPFAENAQDTDKTKLPVYGEPKACGQLNKLVDSPNFVEGSLPGDDVIVLYEREFLNGTVSVEDVFIPMADAATMLGAAYDDENGMAQGVDDKPPYIGRGHVTHHVGKSGNYWQAVFYPKLKAKPSGKDYTTRAKDINFVTDKMEYDWEPPVCGKYKVTKDFPTEAEANAYIQDLFKGTAQVPGLPKPAAG